MPFSHVVLGAGPLARATVQALTGSGIAVRVIHRSGTFPASTEVEVLALDLLDANGLAAACRGAEVVYMCAQPPYHRWPEEFPSLLQAVTQACIASGAGLVMGDNLYMYGSPAPGTLLGEGSATDARTRKGRVRARLAGDLLDLHARGTLRVALARGSDFFGPHVLDSTVGRMVFEPLLRQGTVRVGGDIGQPHSFTFIDDFGASLATLGKEGRGWGEVWHVPNHPALSLREFIGRAATAAGVRPPKIAASGRVGLTLAGMFIPAARESIEMLPNYQQPYVVDDRKWRSRMPGVETPLDEALERTLRWYRGRAAASRP